MAELRDAASDVVYRPLSSLALGGFAISCLFGGMVAFSAVIAVSQGAPFFFPNWTLFVAAAGFIVSWCGLSDVRNSEGTKAGQKLASYGMWISLITGTGYFAYSYFTGLALSQQAMAFFLNEEDGFYTQLRSVGRQKSAQDRTTSLNRAFLLSLPPPDRANANPADDASMLKRFDKPTQDGSPGLLARFRSDHLVLAVSKGGGDVTIEPLGVSTWKYEQRSYHVTCLFRIKSLEANVELAITARSADGEAEGQGRQWFVDMTSTQHKQLQRTPYGEGMMKVRQHAIGFAQALEDRIRRPGQYHGELAELDKTDWTLLDTASREELKSRVKAILDGTDVGSGWHFQAAREGMVADWDFDGQGRLTLATPLLLVLSDAKQQFATRGELAVTLQSKAAVEPDKIGAAEKPAMPDWDLKQIKVVRGNPAGRK